MIFKLILTLTISTIALENPLVNKANVRGVYLFFVCLKRWPLMTQKC